MQRAQWMFPIALAIFSSACAMGTTDEDPASAEEFHTSQSLKSRPIADGAIRAALSSATLASLPLSDPFDDAEVDQAGTTVNTPKPPWPATCNALSDHAVSIGMRGPDGGTCTTSGTTSNCRETGETCTCELTGETRSGDCNDDGSKDTLIDPAQTQGLGF